jgi:hypothetical protein
MGAEGWVRFENGRRRRHKAVAPIALLQNVLRITAMVMRCRAALLD